MVMRCAVEGCQSSSAIDKVGYFSVPSIITRQDDETREISTRRRSLWIARLGEGVDESKVNSNTRVCGRHFVSGKPARLRDQNSEDWLPTIGVHIKFDEENYSDSDGGNSLSIKSEPVSVSPFHWEVDVQMEEDPDDPQFKGELQEFGSVVNNGSQTDILNEDWICTDYHDQVVADNLFLRSENERLKAKICEFSEEQLNGDDSKVEFYTGLPTFSALKLVFEFVSVKVEYTPRSSLSRFQEFMVVMVRLRLNLLEQDLAYRFGVSLSTICDLMNRWLRSMSISLRKCIFWPERETLYKIMPDCFQAAFENKVAVIIDCFQNFIERQEISLDHPKSGTDSQYNHLNIVKFLIGLTPVGRVLFVSKAWVGQISDTMLAEKSKICDNLLPGDVVLSECEFKPTDSVALFKNNLSIPVFTKERTQDEREEAHALKEVANLKVHVEKIIGLVQHKFRILQSSVPLNYLSPQKGDLDCPMDHIITICCALVNLCPSVIPSRSSELDNDYLSMLL